VTTLDWVILGFAAFCALTGFRRGLIRTVCSLAGLVAGAVVGARLAADLVSDGGRPDYASLVALGGALVGAALLSAAARVVGSAFRVSLRLAPPLRLLDSLGGLAAGAAWGLALAWLAGAVAVELPGGGRWHEEARRSQVLHRLNEVAEPRDVLELRVDLFERA
jgi:uncharacterized membrane protein required for colicin V production